MRANPFEQYGPNDQIQPDLAPGRKLIVVPQFEPALQQQERRQRARNQQHIVEIIAHKRAVHARFNYPSVQHIKAAAKQKQRISQITEGLQSRARMTNPNPTATTNFSKSTIIGCNIIADAAQFTTVFVDVPTSFTQGGCAP